MIERERIRRLNQVSPRDGAYVLYWMSQAQRARFNPALELAVREANARDRPVVVGFGLWEGLRDANARHYAFLLQGLGEVAVHLADRGIGFVLRRGRPPEIALALAKDASLLIADRGYLRGQRKWLAEVVRGALCPVIGVEGEAVVPVSCVSTKAEYAARTIRPKIERQRDHFLGGLAESEVKRSAEGATPPIDLDPTDWRGALSRLDVDGSVSPVVRFKGGTAQARARLTTFLRGSLDAFAEGRREPADGNNSFLSPYLHFGQISPVEIARKIARARSGEAADRGTYLEELIVRRELAINHVLHRKNYDGYAVLPDWAKATLARHRPDPRAHRYDRERLESADTHDPYWNAAMREMTATGFMHNTLRMYWGKKILEWSATPEAAFDTALALNNRYFLDGRDANSYANVAWCFGLHDRPWFERPVFGTVRYMNDKGLERKFDMDRYIVVVDRLVAAEAEARPPRQSGL